MVVISAPRRELVGEGKLMKNVLECTEMYLAGKKIEKIRGFEDFVNLEALDFSRNKLEKVNNLEANMKVKKLLVQDNEICTLKGSLTKFKFLAVLDLGNNKLRDLMKQLAILEKFLYLRYLNLKGNPLCEEPDYRLLVIHALPQLEILDMHSISKDERQRAKSLFGGDLASTIAFGQRIPSHDLSETNTGIGGSSLEQELAQEAARVRELKLRREREEEEKLFSTNPYPVIQRGSRLPPNAGSMKASKQWSKNTNETEPPLHHSSWREEQKEIPSLRQGPIYQSHGDVFMISSVRPNPSNELLRAGTHLNHLPAGHHEDDLPIKYEKKKYIDFVARKVAGEGHWTCQRDQMTL